MAAQLSVRMQARKIDLITPMQGKLLFAHLYKTQQGQIGVLPFQSKAIGVDTNTPQPDLRLLLESMEAGGRAAYLMDWLCQQIASTLGLASAQQVPLQQPLFELGIDSLMALELRKSFAAALGFPLPATLLFEYPTVEKMALWLLTQLEPEPSKRAEPQPAVVLQDHLIVGQPKENLAELSAEELMALIEQEFTNNQRRGYSNE